RPSCRSPGRRPYSRPCCPRPSSPSSPAGPSCGTPCTPPLVQADQPVLVGVPLLPLVLEALGLGDLALVEEAVAVGVVHLEPGLGVDSLLLAGAFPLLGAAPGPLGGSARRLRVLAVPDRLLACLRSLLPVFEELLFGQLAVGDPLFLGERLQRVAPPHRLL